MSGLDNNLISLTNQGIRSGMDEMPRLAQSDDVDNEFNANNGMLQPSDDNDPQILKMRLVKTQAALDGQAIIDLHQKTKQKLKADGLANLGAISLAGASLINQYVADALKKAAQRAQAVQTSPESKKIIGGLSEGGGEETTDTTTDTQHAEESKKPLTPVASEDTTGEDTTSEAAQEAVEPGRENLPFSELGQASDLAKEKQKAYAQHELENQLSQEGQPGDQEETGEQAPDQAQDDAVGENMNEMAMADQLHKQQAQQRQAQNAPETDAAQQQAVVQQIAEMLQAGAANDPQLGEQLSQLGIAAGSKNSPRARRSSLKRGRENMQQHLASKLMSLKFANAPVALILALCKDIVDAMEPTILTHIVNIIVTLILGIILYLQQEWFYKKILTNMLMPIIAGIVAEAIPGLNIIPIYTTEICIMYIQSYVEHHKQKNLNENVIPLMDKLAGESGGGSGGGSPASGKQAA